MKNWLIAPLTVVGLGLLQSVASAAIIRYPSPTPYTTSVLATPTDVTNVAALPPVPKFDASIAAADLGLPLVALRGVEIAYEVTVDTSEFTVTNRGTNATTARVFFDYTDVTAKADTFGSGLDVSSGEFGFVNYDATTALVPPGDFVLVDPPAQTKTVVKTITSGLANFQVGSPPSDDFNVLLTSDFFSDFIGGNSSISPSSWITEISLLAEVTYLVEELGNDPDSIPEPTSVLALGLLGLSLGALGKKQKL